jgi:uncharacterized protein with FMN-binding domain
MQESSSNTNTPKVVGAVAISAVLLIGAYIFLTKDMQTNKVSAKKTTSNVSSVSTTSASTSTQTPSTSSSGATSNTQTAPTSSATTSYKDGTYKTTTEYYVPHGSNSLTVNVSIKDGLITKVSTSHDYSDRESGMYVDSFDSSISSEAVGQKIDGLSLSRVGGASLTTEAFDEAISQISNKAKS